MQHWQKINNPCIFTAHKTKELFFEIAEQSSLHQIFGIHKAYCMKGILCLSVAVIFDSFLIRIMRRIKWYTVYQLVCVCVCVCCSVHFIVCVCVCSGVGVGVWVSLFDIVAWIYSSRDLVVLIHIVSDHRAHRQDRGCSRPQTPN